MRDFWRNFIAFSLAIFVHVLLFAVLWFSSGFQQSSDTDKKTTTTDCINPELGVPVETVNEDEVEDAIARMEEAEAIKRQDEIERNADIRDKKAELEKITEEQLQEMSARETALLEKEANAQAKAEAALNKADLAQETAATAQAAAQAAALSEAAATQKLADLQKLQTEVDAQRKASEEQLVELALRRKQEAEQKAEQKIKSEAELANLQAELNKQKQQLETQRQQAKKERKAHEEMLKTKQLDKLKKQQAKAAALKKQQAKVKAAALKKQKAKAKAAALKKRQAKAAALKKQQAKAAALKKRQAKAKTAALKKQKAIAAQKQADAQNSAATAQAMIAAKSKMQRHLIAIKNKIPKYWIRPQNTPDGLQCVLSISTSETGQVLNVRTIESSGNAQFDRSAVAAAWAATPLPVPSDKNLYRGILPNGSKTDGFNVIQMTFSPR
jgi:colicin import membrane protein